MADNFCSNCGKGVTQEDKFCPECGKSLVLASLAAEIPSDLDIGQPRHYLRGDKAGIIGGILLFIGFILLYGVIVTWAYIWVMIPLILIVLGIGLFLRKFD